jgi:hypothetical protein
MEKIYQMRYLISVPFYSDTLKEVNEAMDKIAESIEVPYVSVSVEDDEGKRTFINEKEY